VPPETRLGVCSLSSRPHKESSFSAISFFGAPHPVVLSKQHMRSALQACRLMAIERRNREGIRMREDVNRTFSGEPRAPGKQSRKSDSTVTTSAGPAGGWPSRSQSVCICIGREDLRLVRQVEKQGDYFRCAGYLAVPRTVHWTYSAVRTEHITCRTQRVRLYCTCPQVRYCTARCPDCQHVGSAGGWYQQQTACLGTAGRKRGNDTSTTTPPRLDAQQDVSAAQLWPCRLHIVQSAQSAQSAQSEVLYV
jgi:hypothetical protein